MLQAILGDMLVTGLSHPSAESGSWEDSMVHTLTFVDILSRETAVIECKSEMHMIWLFTAWLLADEEPPVSLEQYVQELHSGILPSKFLP